MNNDNTVLTPQDDDILDTSDLEEAEEATEGDILEHVEEGDAFVVPEDAPVTDESETVAGDELTVEEGQ